MEGTRRGPGCFQDLFFFTVCFFWVLVFGKIIFVWCLGAFTVVEDKQKKRKSKKGKNKRKNSREKVKSIMMNRKKKQRKMSRRTSRESRAGRVEPEKGPNTVTEWNGHFDRGEKATALETEQQAAWGFDCADNVVVPLHMAPDSRHKSGLEYFCATIARCNSDIGRIINHITVRISSTRMI